MKVIDCPRYGPPGVVRIIDKPIPSLGPDQVLVRVVVSTVTTADARVRALDMPSPTFSAIGRIALGFRGPRARVLGTELAGIVHAVSPGVSSLAVGERVVATPSGWFGAHSEYVALKATSVVRVPGRLTCEEAVALPFGACTALYFLDKLARIREGQRLLILGGTGSVGTAAVQIAAHRGAIVYATARPMHAALVRSLGAHHTIDHTSANPLDTADRFDVILDTRGITNFAAARSAMTPTGVFLPVVATMREFRQAFITCRGRVRTGIASDSTDVLQRVMDLAAAGVLKPVIGARFNMDQIAEAYALVDSGRKLGTAILRIGED